MSDQFSRKIADLTPQEACVDINHFPPEHQVGGFFTAPTRPPGVYEHICPTCGLRTEFRVLPDRRPTYYTWNYSPM